MKALAVCVQGNTLQCQTQIVGTLHSTVLLYLEEHVFWLRKCLSEEICTASVHGIFCIGYQTSVTFWCLLLRSMHLLGQPTDNELNVLMSSEFAMDRSVTIVLSPFLTIHCSKGNNEMTMGKIVMNVVAKILNLNVIFVPHMNIKIDNEHQLYKSLCRSGYGLSYVISTYAIASQHFFS